MDETLRDFVAKHIIHKEQKQVAFGDAPKETLEDVNLLDRAGFRVQSKMMARNLSNYQDAVRNKKLADRYKGMVLNVPVFKNKPISVDMCKLGFVVTFLVALGIGVLVGFLYYYFVGASNNFFIFPSVLLGVIAGGIIGFIGSNVSFDLPDADKYKFLKIDSNRYLWECTPQEYTGPVTQKVAQEVIKAEQHDFTAKVWFVATKDEVKKGLISPIKPLDPVLVGYNDKIVGVGKVALLAVWGDDLEDINALFNKSIAKNEKKAA